MASRQAPRPRNPSCTVSSRVSRLTATRLRLCGLIWPSSSSRRNRRAPLVTTRTFRSPVTGNRHHLRERGMQRRLPTQEGDLAHAVPDTPGRHVRKGGHAHPQTRGEEIGRQEAISTTAITLRSNVHVYGRQVMTRWQLDQVRKRRAHQALRHVLPPFTVGLLTRTLAEAAANGESVSAQRPRIPVTWLALINSSAGVVPDQSRSEVQPLNRGFGDGARRRGRQFTGRRPQQSSHILHRRLKPGPEARVE